MSLTWNPCKCYRVSIILQLILMDLNPKLMSTGLLFIFVLVLMALFLSNPITGPRVLQINHVFVCFKAHCAITVNILHLVLTAVISS